MQRIEVNLKTGEAQAVNLTQQEIDATQARIVAEAEARKPRAVTMRQARLALHEAGLLASVTAALEAMEGEAGEAARIEWEYATAVERDWPLVAMLAGALNLTTQQLDALFEQAAKK